MKAAVCLCVLAALTVANGAPHGYVPFIGAIDQTVVSEEVSKPVAYGYRVKTSTIDGFPTSVTEEHVKTGAYGYKIKAAVPVLVHNNVAPIAGPVTVSQEERSADVTANTGAFSYSVQAAAPVVAHGPLVATVPISYEQTVVKSADGEVEDKASGSFAYSYHAEAPVVAPVPVAHHAVFGSRVAVAPVAVKTEEVSGQSGAFAYSVHAEAPVVAPVAVVAPAPVAYSHAVVKSEEVPVEDKPSGSFAYSYHAEAPVVAPVPVAHHAVFGSRVAVAPVAVQFKESAEKTEEVSGQSGAFAYSVHAEAPVAAPVPVVAPAPVAYSHTVVKSEEVPVEDKPSGSFSYSYSAEAPISAPVPVVHHAVVPSAVAIEFKDAAEKTEEVSGQSGAFAYSVHAEAPVVAQHAVVASPVAVEFKSSAEDIEAASKGSGAFTYNIHEAPVYAHSSYVAAAPVGVAYEQSVVNFGDKIAHEKNAGSFGYSYHADAPVVVAPVAHAVYSSAPVAVAPTYVSAPVAYKTISTGGAVSAEVASHDASYGYYVQSGAPLAELETKEPVTTKEVTVKSLGYHGAFGVRTLPLRTVFTEYEPSPVQVESN